MESFFEARYEEEKRRQEARIPYRRKFFDEACKYDSHHDTLRRLADERILEIKTGENTAEVVTEQEMRYKGKGFPARYKFILLKRSDSWVIDEVLTACHACQGRGDPDCLMCHGEPWRRSF